MRIACWVPTHSGCAILIGFTLQQWLHERASLLRYSSLTGYNGVCLLRGTDCILILIQVNVSI
jgi:hypothetical protein